jgi:hypothetical protein
LEFNRPDANPIPDSDSEFTDSVLHSRVQKSVEHVSTSWEHRKPPTEIKAKKALEVIKKLLRPRREGKAAGFSPFTSVVRRTPRRCVSCSLEITIRNDPWCVKPGEGEKEMRLFLSVRYRRNTNKVRHQTCKLNARL